MPNLYFMSYILSFSFSRLTDDSTNAQYLHNDYTQIKPGETCYLKMEINHLVVSAC